MWTEALSLSDLRGRERTLERDIAWRRALSARKQRLAAIASLPAGVLGALTVGLLEVAPGVSTYGVLSAALAASIYFGVNWSATTDGASANLDEVRLEEIKGEIDRRGT